jgi:FKBP-type peptidyl-prolyl cis-trans isomerase (trigger factor)
MSYEVKSNTETEYGPNQVTPSDFKITVKNVYKKGFQKITDKVIQRFTLCFLRVVTPAFNDLLRSETPLWE